MLPEPSHSNLKGQIPDCVRLENKQLFIKKAGTIYTGGYAAYFIYVLSMLCILVVETTPYQQLQAQADDNYKSQKWY